MLLRSKQLHRKYWRTLGGEVEYTTLCSNARCGSARHGTVRRKHRFPYCCVRVFSREVFTGPLPSNTRYTAPSLRLFVPNKLTVYHLSFSFKSCAFNVFLQMFCFPCCPFSERYIRTLFKGGNIEVV
jgi:hypothetical protein